ncbi:MAG: MarR family transcriptional regulator, partial [Gammaproteobacteria bacterium]|nr:MarR family transcriptional regulator [Gammaproteobacteria bacterium]
MLHSHQLTDQQWRIIRVLAGKKNIETFELARQSMVPPPSLTRILKNFEKTGLITRKSDKRDLRKTLINLTPAGWEKFDQVSPEAERIYFAIEEKVGKQELNQLLKSLQKLNTKLHIE